jgi:hypothetical protein
MIDPSTLRKGNWVEHNGKKRFIEEIGKHGIDLYAGVLKKSPGISITPGRAFNF